MGEEQLQGPQAASTAENATSPGKVRFWQTLPGILAAAGTFFAGLAGLAAVVAPNIFPRSSTADAGLSKNDLYIAVKAPDGFVVMRSKPTKDSAEITRISVGDGVHCGNARPNDTGYPWRRCKDEEGHSGYMSDLYLRKE